MLDRNARLVAVSEKFSRPVQRFTGAHEIGHLVLHPNAVMHRDRPVDSVGHGRPLMEREADYFSACFLVPTKVLVEEFRKRFGASPLKFNGVVAYHLAHEGAQDLLKSPQGSLRFELAAATAQSFDRLHFQALHTMFGVSAGAMAIRLRELELVSDR
jgi:hypothetical protein